MGTPDEPGIDERHPAGVRRNLQTVTCGSPTGEPEARSSHAGDSTWAHRCADRGTEAIAENLESSIGERTETDPIERIGPFEEVGEWLDDLVVLRVDVDEQIRPGREQVLEERDRRPAVDARP